jgi:hypothetical protein
MGIVTWSEADKGQWRTVNVSQMIRNLLNHDRLLYVKATDTYEWRSCSFKWEVNSNARMFPETELNNSIAWITCLSGKDEDLSLLFEKFQLAANHASASFIILPVKQNTQKAKATVNSDVAKLVSKHFPEKLDRTNLESEWKSTIPFHAYIPPTTPMLDRFSKYLAE